MVKKLSIIFAYSVFFLLSLALFVPKSSVYFSLEQELQKNKIVLSNEVLEENFLSLSIKDVQINFDEVETARVEKIDVLLLGLYNSVSFSKIELSSLVSSFVPSKIQNLALHYTFLNPLEIRGEAQGDFGEASVKVSLADLKVSVVLRASKLMLQEYKQSLKMLKKEENGEYSYAETFQY